jgi:hypothetical protein
MKAIVFQWFFSLTHQPKSFEQPVCHSTDTTKDVSQMATVDKRGNKWRAQIRRKGLGSVSRSFLNKKDAEKWGREAEAKIEAGTFDPKPKATSSDPKETTLAQLIERYRDTVSVKKKGKVNEHCHLNAFLRHSLSKKKLAEITPTQWAEYRDERLKEIKPTSLQRQLAIFKNMYAIAIDEWGFDIGNPLTKVKLEVVDQRRDRRLQDGEREKILADAGRRRNKQLVPVIKWAIESAMRTGLLPVL